MKNEFWFEKMQTVTFEFPLNVKKVTVAYTYDDENGEEKNGIRIFDFTKEEKYGDRR